MKKSLVTIFVALFLTSCAQGFGTTEVEMTMREGDIQTLKWIDGKEKAHVEIVAVRPDGSEFRYTASDVQAFDGQRIAADLHKALAEAGVEVSESVVRGVVAGVLGKSVVEGAASVAPALIRPPIIPTNRGPN